MQSKDAIVLGQRVQLMNQRAMFALLLENFHLTPRDIALLTDRQIHEYYFHPRDKHGAIKTAETVISVPKAEGYEDNLRALKSLKDANFISDKDYQKLKEELGNKYGQR